MIENIEQAKERLKEIVDFYKLNDTDNYDYDDRVLISMKLVLEEIERLNNIINELENEKDRLGSLFYERNEENIRLNNIIKEVRELRKQLAFEYYENGLEVGINVVIEDLDKILDKENK